MSTCPKCGDSTGARFISVERNVYILDWESGDAECVECEGQVSRTMPECIACGHKFRWATIEQMQEATNGQE